MGACAAAVPRRATHGVRCIDDFITHGTHAHQSPRQLSHQQTHKDNDAQDPEADDKTLQKTHEHIVWSTHIPHHTEQPSLRIACVRPACIEADAQDALPSPENCSCALARRRRHPPLHSAPAFRLLWKQHPRAAVTLPFGTAMASPAAAYTRTGATSDSTCTSLSRGTWAHERRSPPPQPMHNTRAALMPRRYPDRAAGTPTKGQTVGGQRGVRTSCGDARS